jgi:CBS-domain-containing membrane protein
MGSTVLHVHNGNGQDDNVIVRPDATVRDVMRREVTLLTADTSCEDATALLLTRGLPGAAILDEKQRLIGYVTLADLLRHQYERGDTSEVATPTPRELGNGFHNAELISATVAEWMSPVPCALGPDSSLPHAISALAASAHWLPELPVVSMDGAVVGLLACVDVLRFQIVAR